MYDDALFIYKEIKYLTERERGGGSDIFTEDLLITI